jgi:hypothetical protein
MPTKETQNPIGVTANAYKLRSLIDLGSPAIL